MSLASLWSGPVMTSDCSHWAHSCHAAAPKERSQAPKNTSMRQTFPPEWSWSATMALCIARASRLGVFTLLKLCYWVWHISGVAGFREVWLWCPLGVEHMHALEWSILEHSPSSCQRNTPLAAFWSWPMGPLKIWKGLVLTESFNFITDFLRHYGTSNTFLCSCMSFRSTLLDEKYRKIRGESLVLYSDL